MLYVINMVKGCWISITKLSLLLFSLYRYVLLYWTTGLKLVSNPVWVYECMNSAFQNRSININAILYGSLVLIWGRNYADQIVTKYLLKLFLVNNAVPSILRLLWWTIRFPQNFESFVVRKSNHPQSGQNYVPSKYAHS